MAAREFTVSIRPSGQGATYNSLNGWEAGQQDNLTTGSIKVFYGSLTGSGMQTTTVYLKRDSDFLNITGSAFCPSLNDNNILVRNISNPNFSFQVGDVWSGSSNRTFTINDTGSSPIMVALLDGNWSGSVDSTSVTIGGWTTSAENYILIKATGSTSRHNGVWSDEKYTREGIIATNDFFTIDGLQIFRSGSTSSQLGISIGATTSASINIKNCLFKGIFGGSANILYAISINGPVTSTINNCIAWNWGNGTNFGSFVFTNSAGAITRIYNCTTFNSYWGYRNNSSGFFETINCIWQSGSIGNDGFQSALGDYNISNKPSDAPGVNSKVGNVLFLDSSSYNFNLSSEDILARNSGSNLVTLGSSSIDTDIIENLRVNPWDIGAFEYISNEIQPVLGNPVFLSFYGIGNNVLIGNYNPNLLNNVVIIK